uniref:Uncharacterized protein n=1 Tax=Lepeophtheirus salmonis TaxID=72036 RepID=A0A0K2SYT6_LEPSM
MDLNLYGEKVKPPESNPLKYVQSSVAKVLMVSYTTIFQRTTWFDRGFGRIFARGRIHLKQKMHKSMHFNSGSYKRDLEHDLLNLIPRKRLKTDTVPSLLLPLFLSLRINVIKSSRKICMNQHPLKLPAVSIIKVKTK